MRLFLRVKHSWDDLHGWHRRSGPRSKGSGHRSPPIRIPVGHETLSRIMNVIREPSDERRLKTLVYGQMNEPLGGHARVTLNGLIVAEYFRDQEGRDILLIDNIFRFTQARIRGEYDALPEQAFYMVGPIEEGIQKTEKQAEAHS